MSYEEFERLAEHYGAAVYPARTRKPKDKSHVKNTVKLIYKDIFTALNGLHCPDMPL
jgi:transposase